jgi:diguanylate cyclase (GGDEF)-like protein/PAS domain S-box-containing protein
MRLACFGTAAAGLAALVSVLVLSGATVQRTWLFPFFLAVLLFAYARPVNLWHDGQAETLSLDEALFVPMALLLTSTEVMLAIAATVILGYLWRRVGWAKLIWNFGAMTVSAAIGLATFHLFCTLAGTTMTPGRPPAALAVIGAFIGGLVYDVVSGSLVAHIISIVESRSFKSVILEGVLVRLAMWIGALSLGVLVAFAASRDHVILVLVIVPVGVLHLTYAAAVTQWRERQRIESLYAAALSIQDSIDGDEVRRRLVDAARHLVGAGSAAVLAGEAGADATPVADGEARPDGAMRVELGAQSTLEVRDRITGGTWDRRDEDMLRALAGVAAGALHNAELYEQIKVLTSSLGEGVFAVDRDGRTWFMNPAAGEMLGLAPDDVIGHPLHERIGGDLEQESAFLQRVLATGETVRNEDALFARGDGSMLPVASTTAPVMRDGEVVGAVVTFRDVTERKAFELQLAHQAFHDTLTDLPNRALFLDRLHHAMARSRHARRHALLFIDVDRFKVVNDSLGHQVGDQLLTMVAARLRSCLRRGDTLARFGGDEFTVLMEDIDDSADAMAAAERIITALTAPFEICERELVVSASIGIACTNDDYRSPDELVAFADIAMYRAKAKGGGFVDIYDAETEHRALERLELEIALRQAIQTGQLEVFYQPVFSVTTGRITGTEALVRWNHPTMGQILPGGFINLAEETGLIVPLGRFVLLEACCQTKEWQDAHPEAPPLTVCVNLSTRQLQRTSLIDDVQDILSVSGLDAAALCLEITESAMLEEAAVVAANLAGLKRLGVRLAIDDFGTGYSSLSYLKRFPVDVVKIDRSFTSGLGQREVDRDIVTAIVQLARAIGAQAVAEGVETPAQLEELRSVGCPGAQGFYLSRPKPRDEIELLLLDLWAGSLTNSLP